MFRSVWEIVTDVKPVLPENAYPRMETTEVGMVTAARLLLLNAAPPMLVTELGIITEVRLLFMNALNQTPRSLSGLTQATGD